MENYLYSIRHLSAHRDIFVQTESPARLSETFLAWYKYQHPNETAISYIDLKRVWKEPFMQIPRYNIEFGFAIQEFIVRPQDDLLVLFERSMGWVSFTLTMS